MRAKRLKFVLSVAAMFALAWSTTAAADTISITANGQASPAIVYVNSPVALVATVSGCQANGQWQGAQWNFGDSQTQPSDASNVSPCSLSQAELTATHTFATVGTYTVTYSYQSCSDIRGNSCKAWTTFSGSIQVQVNQPASALQIVVPGETATPGVSPGKTGVASNQIVGQVFQITVNAVDENWNVQTGVADTIHLTSSDSTATLPADATLVNGTVTFIIEFNQAPGPFTITASDVTDGTRAAALSSEITVDVPSAGGFGAIDTDIPVFDSNGKQINFYPVTPQKLPITTKIAGESFSLQVVAWQTYYQYVGVTPSYSGTVTVELLNASDNSGALDQYGCRSTWTQVIASVDVTIPGSWQTTNGGGHINVTFPSIPDAWPDVRVRIIGYGKKDTPGCSTDDFAIRPAYFAVAASDQDTGSPGTTRVLNVATPPVAGGADARPFHKAGQPFTLTATPMNAAATPAKTAGYSIGTPAATAIQTVLGANLGQLAIGVSGWMTGNGDAVTNAATYSEAGALSVQVTDADFAIVDAADTPACQRTIGLTCDTGNPNYPYWTAAANAGRFVPDHFAVVRNTPEFATGCASGQFTYTGKAFTFAAAPVVSITAQNAAGVTTKNYTGSLFRLADTSLTGRSYTDASAPAAATLDTAGLPPTTSDPAIVDNGDGTGTLTFSAGAGLDYMHAIPVAPFNSLIDLSINVQDLDGVTVDSIDGNAAVNPVVFDAIPFDNGNQVRYGRVFVNTAVGSELLSLPVEMVAQYYKDTDTGFITNTADTCTTVTMPTTFAVSKGATVTGSTTPTFTTAAAGDFGLVLSAPGDGHDGSADLSATVPPWLQFDWNGDGAYSDNPTSRATFGLYQGNPHRVYQREVVGP